MRKSCLKNGWDVHLPPNSVNGFQPHATVDDVKETMSAGAYRGWRGMRSKLMGGIGRGQGENNP